MHLSQTTSENDQTKQHHVVELSKELKLVKLTEKVKK